MARQTVNETLKLLDQLGEPVTAARATTKHRPLPGADGQTFVMVWETTPR